MEYILVDNLNKQALHAHTLNGLNLYYPEIMKKYPKIGIDIRSSQDIMKYIFNFNQSNYSHTILMVNGTYKKHLNSFKKFVKNENVGDVGNTYERIGKDRFILEYSNGYSRIRSEYEFMGMMYVLVRSDTYNYG